ncbi:hypothetical protein [Leptolyngbya sp. PCC 6406]|uniref:hypothetical protein n=1 Tax=Leptolyngbya sp. PCC 6406 TaxID=1173264 RepID=UPI0002ABF12E|nr:hypothetical protein [Leptolyngbya sp. PCC 6406]
MTAAILPRGVSSTATYIDQVSRDNQQYFAHTAALSKQPAIDELVTTWAGCKLPNWDGYDAFPAKEETLNYAYAVIQALPLGFPLPSVGAEPDGHLTLEWYRDPHWTISVSISPEGILYYAALLGNSDPRGSEPFLGEVPKRLLNLIQEVALVKN